MKKKRLCTNAGRSRPSPAPRALLPDEGTEQALGARGRGTEAGGAPGPACRGLAGTPEGKVPPPPPRVTPRRKALPPPSPPASLSDAPGPAAHPSAPTPPSPPRSGPSSDSRRHHSIPPSPLGGPPLHARAASHPDRTRAAQETGGAPRSQGPRAWMAEMKRDPRRIE